MKHIITIFAILFLAACNTPVTETTEATTADSTAVYLDTANNQADSTLVDTSATN